jgi:hydroxymethylpyrimidine pyrophosphatase-like HAD family hydrolase
VDDFKIGATHREEQYCDESKFKRLMGNNIPKMTVRDVIEIVQLLNQHHIEFYVDGGWGIDALLGKQTLPHADLDIAIQHKDSPQVRTLLSAREYSDINRVDSSDFNFVLGDNQGHQIDFTLILLMPQVIIFMAFPTH